MDTYYANDRYSATLTAGYSVGQTTLYVSAVPNNVPTIIVAAKGTDNETIFAVTDKTTNSLTGVSRLRGANVDLDAQTPLTCLNNEEFQNQYASIYSQLINGWNELGALTRASDTTATLSGNWTDRLQKGDKLWWKSNGVSRYNYIIGVSYSAPNTTITITAGYVSAANDSRFENGQTITEPKYSKMENPQGFPGWFSWTPSYGATSSMTYTSVATEVAKFSIKGSVLYCEIGAKGTTGGTASGAITVSPPVVPLEQDFKIGGGAVLYDGALLSGLWYSQYNVINFLKYNGADWGLGTNRHVKANFFYRI